MPTRGSCSRVAWPQPRSIAGASIMARKPGEAADEGLNVAAGAQPSERNENRPIELAQAIDKNLANRARRAAALTNEAFGRAAPHFASAAR
jgi:hypothetical protein